MTSTYLAKRAMKKAKIAKITDFINQTVWFFVNLQEKSAESAVVS
jgi:hypothetical protein